MVINSWGIVMVYESSCTINSTSHIPLLHHKPVLRAEASESSGDYLS